MLRRRRRREGESQRKTLGRKRSKASRASADGKCSKEDKEDKKRSNIFSGEGLIFAIDMSID